MNSREKRKILEAIKTCNRRIERELRVNSIISLGNIGAKYPGYVKSIDSLLKLLDREFVIEMINEGNLHRSFYKFVGLNRERLGKFKGYAVRKIKFLALKTIVKIGNANPNIMDPQLVDSIWDEISDVLKKEWYEDDYCRCLSIHYASSLVKYLGLIAKKDDYAFSILKNALFSNNQRIRYVAVDGLGFSERSHEVLPYLKYILKIEDFSVSAITKLAAKNPAGYGLEILKNLPECKTHASCVILLGRIAVMDKPCRYMEEIRASLNSPDRRERQAALYAVSLITTKKPQLVRDIVEDKYLEFRGKGIYRIASKDVDFVIHLAKRYGKMDDWGARLIAKRFPEKIIELYLYDSNIVPLDALLIALSHTNIPKGDEDRIRDTLKISIYKTKDHFTLFYEISSASKKNPGLFASMVHFMHDILKDYYSNRSKNSLETEYFLEFLANVGHFVPDEAVKGAIEYPYFLNLVVDVFYSTPDPSLYLTKYQSELVWAISSIRDEIWKSEYMMEGFRRIIPIGEEIVLEFIDEIISVFYGRKYTNKYCIVRAIIILKELIKRGILTEDYTRYIVESLGHPNYRVFNAAKKALYELITEENYRWIMDEAKYSGNEDVIRRVKKIINSKKIIPVGDDEKLAER